MPLRRVARPLSMAIVFFVTATQACGGDDNGSTPIAPNDAGTVDAGGSGDGDADAAVNACLLPDGQLDCANPVCVAPAVDKTVVTSFAAAVRFLYAPAAGACSGSPIQVGVDASAIDPARVAVLSGAARDASGAPLAGVRVAAPGHAELGYTLTRKDGAFDFVVNGGGPVTLRFTKQGLLPIQRRKTVDWNRYAAMEALTLLPPSSVSVDLAGHAGAVVQAATSKDSAGERAPAFYFANGTTAQIVAADGTKTAASALHVRATELTVGPAGPSAMPADLPASSLYTYCTAFTVDEAEKAGAEHVEFDPPLVTYVDNFLGWAPGTTVPSGSYDDAIDQWAASETGVVIAVLSTASGVASIDADGDGKEDDAAALAKLGVTSDELRAIAAKYAAGVTLWRVRVPHFSSYDFNQGGGPPRGALPPTPSADPPDPDCSHGKPGSIVRCESQALEERLPLAGTGHSLTYTSRRASGALATRSLRLKVTGDTLPPGVKDVLLHIEIAGRVFEKHFAPAINIADTFTWDGQDRFGRTLQGRQPIMVRVDFIYDAIYEQTPQFGYSGNGVPIRLLPGAPGTGRKEIALSGVWRGYLGGFDADGLALGGWALDTHHVYDPFAKILYLGDGSQRSVDSMGNVLITVAGSGSAGFAGDGGPAKQASLWSPHGLVVGPDGTVFIADEANHRIRKLAPNGVITTFAGNGTASYSGDGGPATAAALQNPMGLALARDGTLYVADSMNARVRAIAPNGTIRTVAGTGQYATLGDGGPALAAAFQKPHALALGPDGSLYIADSDANNVRRVTPDGIVNRFAGDGSPGLTGDGGSAVKATLNAPLGLTVGPDESVYIADWANNVIRRVTPDGRISTFAGDPTGSGGFSGDGGPAVKAKLSSPHTVVAASDGALYLTDEGNGRIRRIATSGIIDSVAGGGTSLDDGAPLAVRFSLPRVVYAHPDGSVWIADYSAEIVRRFSPPTAVVQSGEFFIPSADAKELFVFDAQGRHARTVDAELGAVRARFAYDAKGLLASVTDESGNATTIARDATGCPSSITGPYGHTTKLSCDGASHLATITDPAGNKRTIAMSGNGLLAEIDAPSGAKHTYAFDANGRLVKDTEAWGGALTLTRSEDATGTRVEVTTAEGRKSVYAVSPQANGGELRTITLPSGLTVTRATPGDATSHEKLADGTVVDVTLGPDPRFGMLSPLVSKLVTTYPAGATPPTARTQTRAVTLVDAADVTRPSTISERITVGGNTVVRTVDAVARAVTTSTAVGRKQVAHFDAAGHIVRLESVPDADIVYAYDARGRLTTATQSTRSFTFTYASDGNLASVSDPLGRVTRFAYDADARLTAITRPDGTTLRATFDVDGNVASITGAGGAEHAFKYAPGGLLASYTPPNVAGAGALGLAWSPDVDLTSLTRPDANVALAYDAAGRLASMNTPQGAIAYGYDPNAGVLSSIKAAGAPDLAIDRDGALVRGEHLRGPGVIADVTFTYDEKLNLTSETTAWQNAAGQTFGFKLDEEGLPTAAGEETLAWDSQRARLRRTVLGGVTDAYDYDAFGAVSSYRAAINGSDTFTIALTRDAGGRVVAKTETVAGQGTSVTYGYDSAGRLASIGGATQTSFAYDANGNRTTLTASGASVASTYDAQDRLLTRGGAAYTFSSGGDLAAMVENGQKTTYDYDVLGSLRKVVLPSGKTIEYVVDGRQRRVGKKVDGALVQTLVYADAWRPVLAIDAAGAVTRFVYGARKNTPDYLVRPGATYRIVTDLQGSPRLVIDTVSGQIMQRIDYDEFGRVLSDSSPGFQPFGFAGGIYDSDTGLVRLGARDYDPATGRFTSKDPTYFDGSPSNLYEYASGDPVNFVDSDGMRGYGPDYWYVSGSVGIPGTDFTVGGGFSGSLASGSVFFNPGGGRSTPGDSPIGMTAGVGWLDPGDPCGGDPGDVDNFLNGDADNVTFSAPLPPIFVGPSAGVTKSGTHAGVEAGIGIGSAGISAGRTHGIPLVTGKKPR